MDSSSIQFPLEVEQFACSRNGNVQNAIMQKHIKEQVWTDTHSRKSSGQSGPRRLMLNGNDAHFRSTLLKCVSGIRFKWSCIVSMTMICLRTLESKSSAVVMVVSRVP
eukprot:scaffold497_cov135-Skeletonema_marinoi.AAC.1